MKLIGAEYSVDMVRIWQHEVELDNVIVIRKGFEDGFTLPNEVLRRCVPGTRAPLIIRR